MKIKIWFAACVAIALFCLSGCQTDFSKPNIDTQITESGIKVYQTDTALSPMEYTLAVNKEIDIALNILEGHMATGKMIADGDYPIQDELLNIASSLDVVQETIESVDSLTPPKEYTDERLSIVQKLTNAKKTLEVYQNYLTDNDLTHVTDAIELMEGDFASLKTAFNNLGE